MKNDELASFSIVKIVAVALILIMCSGIGVLAFNSQIITVKIISANNEEIEILTAKRNVSDILEENHIVVLTNEIITPSLNSDIDDTNTIKISKTYNIDVGDSITKDVTVDEIINSYGEIIEKIIIETQEIPFETTTKDISSGDDTTSKVLRAGKNGIREVKYKVKYENDIEIFREEISSTITQEAVDKIVQVSTKQNIVTSRGSTNRPATGSGNSLAARVEGKTPAVKTMNASAYTDSTCGKSPGDKGYGITASGSKATSWYTLAAGKGYPIGTIMYIPAFAGKANGGWFIVQDRGGAISNSKIDVYMSTYSECIQFGRRNLEVHVFY